MSTKRLIFLTLVAVASLAQARIGETMEEAIQRYGQPVSTSESALDGGTVYHFHKGNFKVKAYFEGGVIAAIMYQKEEMLSEVEIQNFLNDNKAGGDWKKLSWMRWETVKLIAYEGAGLQIGTKAFFEKIRAAQAAKQNKAQEGF